jgi:excisionase family DNA binding protein
MNSTTHEKTVVIDTSDLPVEAKYITTDQLATMLQCSIRTVWRLTAAGLLPKPIRFNRKLVRWAIADVQAWCDRHRTGSQESDPESPVQPSAEVPGDMISAWKAAKILGVHLSTVRTWARDGKIRCFTVGGRMCFSQADVEALFVEVGAGA